MKCGKAMLKHRVKRIEKKIIGKKGRVGYAIVQNKLIFLGLKKPVLSMKDLKESLIKYHEAEVKDKEMKLDA